MHTPNSFGAIKKIKKTLKLRIEHEARKALYRAPQEIVSPIEYADKCKSKGKWHKVNGHELICPKPATNLGSIPLKFANIDVSECAEEGVLEISNAFQFGSWIVSSEFFLVSGISSCSHYTNLPCKNVRIAPRFVHAKRLKGTCLSIATRGAAHYGHWLVESIAKLELFSMAGFDLHDVDYILCHKPLLGTPENLFNHLNIPEKKCIWVESSSPAFRPDVLFAPSHPEIYKKSLPWIPKFLRRRFLPSTASHPQRRLYLTREGYSRNPVNAVNVNRIFARYRFEFFNPELHPASHLVFSEAAIVVGHTGSAMTGIVFCQPGTKVLELISDDTLHTKGGNVFPLISSSECDYNYLVCQSTHYRADSSFGLTPYDFYVNEAELEQALIKLTADL